VTRLVFAGTPEFALVSLQALVDAGRAPVAVLTQPDRPAGRGKKLTASPVKRFARDQGIPVQQPASLRDEQAVEAFAELAPDLLIVAAYGLILPQSVLDIPTHGCLNVHASILPRWRGAAPIQSAILAGDATTGVSLMSMTAGLDCGPVFYAEEIPIGTDETAGELHDRLAALGGTALVAHLDSIIAGELQAVAQEEALATYAPKIDTQDARIDWTMTADEVTRRIRAYNPFPGAFCFVSSAGEGGSRDPAPEAMRLKVWRAAVAGGTGAPGSILKSDRESVVVACGQGAVRLDELQLPGKRRVAAREFVAQLDLVGRRLD
jgi:methionyl-tRNA formyltransferase